MLFFWNRKGNHLILGKQSIYFDLMIPLPYHRASEERAGEGVVGGRVYRVNGGNIEREDAGRAHWCSRWYLHCSLPYKCHNQIFTDVITFLNFRKAYEKIRTYRVFSFCSQNNLQAFCSCRKGKISSDNLRSGRGLYSKVPITRKFASAAPNKVLISSW